MLGVIPSPEIAVSQRRTSVVPSVSPVVGASIDAVQLNSSISHSSSSTKILASTTSKSSPKAANLPDQVVVNQSPVDISHASPQASFSLNLGPLTITGVKSPIPIPNEAVSDPEQAFNNTQGASHQNRTGIQSNVANDNEAPISEEDVEEQVFNPFSDINNSQDKRSEAYSDALEKSEAAEALSQAEQQLLAQLSSRDAEVKAHEQAHSTVGGYLAQSPQFSYEQGSDGRRYAVDGEVQIDIAVVPGDPQATVNKMQKVYAAAMAPTNPSMADIRVASEALKQLNEAKAELVNLRQSQALSIDEMEPLIGADDAIKGVIFPTPHKPQVSGNVDEEGAISSSMVDSPSSIDDKEVISPVIEHINQQLSGSSSVNAVALETLTYGVEQISERYAANDTGGPLPNSETPSFYALV